MKPEGFIDQQVHTSNKLDAFPDALMDDTVYIMDDTSANMGGIIAIYSNITGVVELEKPGGK